LVNCSGTPSDSRRGIQLDLIYHQKMAGMQVPAFLMRFPVTLSDVLLYMNLLKSFFAKAPVGTGFSKWSAAYPMRYEIKEM